MIAFIKGELVGIEESKVILDVHDMGYQIFVSGRELSQMPVMGSEIRLHTYLHVKEDAMQLYGFLNRDDLEVFKLLLLVNGIGPKAALGVLSALSADDLRFAVLADDAKAIAKAPGIGSKTAQKMILELKDKLSLEDAFENKLTNTQAILGKEQLSDARSEAVQALVALGYSNSDALRAVKKAEITENMDTEALLKAALKNMAFL